jgi:hypothetical protein
VNIIHIVCHDLASLPIPEEMPGRLFFPLPSWELNHLEADPENPGSARLSLPMKPIP